MTTPYHILVVDDDPTVVALLKETLTADGYHVSTALNGAEALAWMADRTVCLVITDFVMPGLDGLGLLAVVKQRRPEVPVIFMTASYDEAVLRAAVDGGAERVLSKPIGQREILRLVRTCVHLSYARSSERDGRAQVP